MPGFEFRTFPSSVEQEVRVVIRAAMEPENIFRPWHGDKAPRPQRVEIDPFRVDFHVAECQSMGGGQRVRFRRLAIACTEPASSPDAVVLPSPAVVEAIAALFGFVGPAETWRRLADDPGVVAFDQPMHEWERGQSIEMAATEEPAPAPKESGRYALTPPTSNAVDDTGAHRSR